MNARVAFILNCALFLASAPAVAADSWDCTIHSSPSSGGTEVSPGHVQIQVVGADLLWITPNFTVQGREYPGSTQHRPVILNNDVGVVSASGIATTTPPNVTVNGRSNPAFSAMVAAMTPNPRVEAYVTVLDKHNGTLRVGLVGTTRVVEVDIGECTPTASVTPPSAPNSQ